MQGFGDKKSRVFQILYQKEDEYSEKIPFTLFCGTWNVNGKRPPSSLHEWLCNFDEPDIYVIGFQELDLTGGALLLGDTSRAPLWENAILDTLNSSGSNYSLLQSKQLVGMLLCVLVKGKHIKNVSNFSSTYAGCGLMGKMGNKGGVGIRFQFYDTTLCFVNTHLSAHQTNIQRRNQDYRDICRRLLFPEKNQTSFYSIFRHDILIWLGDLNYRIDMDDFTVRKKIANGESKSLLVHDQLLNQQKQGLVFEKFKEGEINFIPTYKYDSGTHIYDSSEKHRTPAWCDRILWHEKSNIELTFYGRHELLTSDHRPVTSLFKANAKRVIEDKRREVLQNIMQELDKQENDNIPQCELSQSLIEFGEVRYMSPITKSVSIKNIGIAGSSDVNFYFVPPPNVTTQDIGKSWLQVSPEWGVLRAGESMDINLTIYVELEAGSLNLSREDLADILIIRLENGVDHYLEVRGDYIFSCMGNYLDYLIRQPRPIRDKAEPLPTTSPHLLSVPKELWRIIDRLSKFSNYEELFTEDGDLDEVQIIIETLDKETDLPKNCSIHSFGETLLRFLNSLAEPVIPFSMFQRCIDSSSYIQRKTILSSLKTVNYNVFYYIISFLKDFVLRTNATEERTMAIASLFSDVMLRAPTGELEIDPTVRTKADNFIQTFLHVKQLSLP